MKAPLLSVAILVAVIPQAKAEGFTFTGTGQVTDRVTQTVGGKLVTTTYSTVGDQATSATGTKSSLTGSCATQTLPWSRGQEAGSGSCQLADASGSFVVSFACIKLNIEKTAAQCSGTLIGETAAYKGRTGAITWQKALSADA